MGSSEHNNINISPADCSKIRIFGKKALFFPHALSKYLSKSHDFINLVFVMSSLHLFLKTAVQNETSTF